MVSEPLPYHCSTLNGNFFKPPCERQIAMAKERREKFPNAMIGLLDKCLDCGGKNLVKREKGVDAVTTLPETASNYDKNNDKAVEVIKKSVMAAFVTQKDEMAGIVWKNGDTSKSKPFNHGHVEQGPLKVTIKTYPQVGKKCISCKAAIRPGIPCGISSAYAWTFCLDCIEPKGGSGVEHDGVEQGGAPRPGLEPSKDDWALRDILGAIDIFEAKGVYPTRMMLAEHLGIKLYKIDLLIKELRTRGEVEIVPNSWPNEVRKLGQISSTASDGASIITGPECEKEAQIIPEIFQPTPMITEEANMAGVVSFKTQGEAVGKIPEPEIPICTRPDCEAPGSPVKIDKLGRSMGMCAACVSARGKRGGYGCQSGKPPASVEAMLDQPKYAELKAWLEAQADEYERTLLQEIIYRLKISMQTP